MSRKCKVCGRDEDLWMGGRAWCKQCTLAWDRGTGMYDNEDAAEWGAKRRAAAQKKAGGK